MFASGVLAWRWRDSLTASGWATIALLVTLSWVLPWYILWVLPMAALSRSRKLRVAALALGAYLILTWMPRRRRRWTTRWAFTRARRARPSCTSATSKSC